jgi:hypothetical protein
MKSALELRCRLAFGREILAWQATFLPVEPARPAGTGPNYAAEMQHSGGFLPDFNINRKKMTVARPLLLEELR